MRFFYKEQKVRNGYLTAFGLLMISYFLVFYIIRQMEKRAKMVSHTSELINNLDILLSCIKDSETSFRGFIIMHDSALLEPYRFHIVCINSSFDRLTQLIGDDKVQRVNIDSLYTKVTLNLNLINLTILDINSNMPSNGQTINRRISRGTRYMNDIANLVSKMQAHENEKLARRTSEFENISRTLKIVHFTTFLIALLLAVYFMITFSNVSIAKRQYREQLESGIEKLKIANTDLVNLRSIEKFAASGRIARSIAHEVRNPLTSISLATEQLSTAITSNEDSTLLDIISRNVKRIHTLVLDLLDSTKFSQLNLNKVSLNTIVEKALELAWDRIELNEIKVITNISQDPCLVEADVEKMKIAVLNLIVNAIEAVEPQKGIIEINTYRVHDKCLALIRDNGVGMNENAMVRIFEPYFTQKENGNGLGLTLTQNIILNHKGNISVESQPNQGTTFTITLNHAG